MTVEQDDCVVMARINLLSYHIKRGLLFPGMDERNRELHGLIDALIAAAVSASQASPLQCDQCELKQSEWHLPLVEGEICPRHYLDDDSCDGVIARKSFEASLREGAQEDQGKGSCAPDHPSGTSNGAQAATTTEADSE